MPLLWIVVVEVLFAVPVPNPALLNPIPCCCWFSPSHQAGLSAAEEGAHRGAPTSGTGQWPPVWSLSVAGDARGAMQVFWCTEHDGAPSMYHVFEEMPGRHLSSVSLHLCGFGLSRVANDQTYTAG
jgi:hypothetical protein